MSDTVHTVLPGETLQDISRKYYGVESDYVIILKANSFLKESEFVEAGETLVIPDPFEVEFFREEVLEDLTEDNYIDIEVAGLYIEKFINFSIKRSIDQAADQFSFVVQWDHKKDDDLKRVFEPFAYSDIEIRIRGLLF